MQYKATDSMWVVMLSDAALKEKKNLLPPTGLTESELNSYNPSLLTCQEQT